METLASRNLRNGGPVISFARHERYPGWTLVIDGFYHSNLDLDGEPKLNFDYAKRVAYLTDHFFPAGQPISVLHLGGGALSIPRYIEVEEDVITFTQEHFPLAADTNIELIYADAANIGTIMKDRYLAFDLILCDVYMDYLAPTKQSALNFYSALYDLLSDDGVVVINAVDALATQGAFASKHFDYSKEVFDRVAVLADVEDLEEGRKTNILIVAGGIARLESLEPIESADFGLTAVIEDSAR
jgi:spermidine synthase